MATGAVAARPVAPPFPSRAASAKGRTMRPIAPLAALLFVAACAAPPPPPRPAPAPPPAPARPAPPPAPVVAWQDGPATPGNWHWQQDARGSVAMFGIAGQPALFVVRCDVAQRRISLTMPGTVTEGTALTLWTGDAARVLPAATAGGEPPYAGAALPATDGFLDRLAYSRGRFRAQLGSAPPLVIPAWPEYARTIEDCRG